MGLYGGGGSTNTENPYDDQWIKDWMATAESMETGYSDRLAGAEGINTAQSTQIGDLFGRTDEATRRLNELGTWNQDRINEISGLTGDVSGINTKLSDLETLVSQPTTTGDVQGLDSIISNLQDRYTTADRNIGLLSESNRSAHQQIGNLRTSTREQLDSAISGLGINQYLKTSDFNTRMSDNLGTLGDTLRGEFGADIAALDLPGVRDSISAARGDIGSLTEDFAGLSSDMDWIKKLDLGTFDDRLTAQASDFSGRLSSTEDRFGKLLGGQTGNLTKLIN
jgi:hypothetical protein